MILVGKLLPALANSQGDAENAEAIVTTLGWMSRSATVRDFAAGAQIAHCDAYVLGHVTESDFEVARDQLLVWAEELRASVTAGSVILAVGSALELLVSVGLLTGSVSHRSSRNVSDCVVHFGDVKLWGFENSAASYRRSDAEEAWGRVQGGCGNGDGTEGVRVQVGQGLVLGTHLHGPVLVRNQELMDEVLAHITKMPYMVVTDESGLKARLIARENRAEMIARSE